MIMTIITIMTATSATATTTDFSSAFGRFFILQ